MMTRRLRLASPLLVMCLGALASAEEPEAQRAALEVTPPEQPGTEVELVAFFPDRAGDSWRFARPDDAQSTLTRQATEDAGGLVLRLDDSSGLFRLRAVDAATGLVWSEESRLGGRRLVFPGGHRLLPGRVETGATYAAEGRYRTLVDEQESAAGRVRSTVRVLELETLELPAGSFEDCLVLQIDLQFVPDAEDGRTSSRRLRQWRARGVGPVREIVRGAAAPFEPDDDTSEWVLIEASVGGTLVPDAGDLRPAIDLGPFETPPRPGGD